IINDSKNGMPDISREGVQRDLLPIVEGTDVSTKYGIVKTDHILFISAGAFHLSKPSDMIPELQGRFPIRVELNALDKQALKKILTLPKNALIKQYISLMKTENVIIEFSDEAIDLLSDIAVELNQTSENIGARRLYTLLEKLLEELSFHAPEITDQKISIDAAFVKKQLEPLMQSKDLREYIL
ncbi:MAG: AAA domain-containing protein, partial [Epsilonproteobacteria bacterium]|nr:AAA domain-containing protein [Campylobacterota bacterium]